MPFNPTSDVGIVNAALVRLGQGPIASFTDPQGTAVAAQQLYETVKRAMLASFHWSFALAEEQPAALASTQNDFTDDFQYAFLVPADCLRVLGVSGLDNLGYDFIVAQDEIWVGISDPQILYIKNVDTGLFPPWFVEAMIAEMAVALSLAATQKEQRAELARKEAERVKRIARHIDSQTRNPWRIKIEQLFLDGRLPRY